MTGTDGQRSDERSKIRADSAGLSTGLKGGGCVLGGEMRRTRWVAVSLVLVVALAGVGPAVAIPADAGPATATATTGSDAAVGPPASAASGPSLASASPVAAQVSDNESGAGTLVVGALEQQDARIESGDLNARLAAGLADAGTAEERARVAGPVLADALDRLSSLEARGADLNLDSATGEAARLRAAATDLHLLAVRTDRVASDLPDGVRAEHGLTDERIERLRRGASRLAGERGPFGPAFYTNLSLMVDRYNEGAEPSGFVANRLTGEVVNLRVTAPAETTVVSTAVADDGRLRDVRAGARDDATLRMTTDRETMAEILAADDPQAALLAAIDRGDVTIRGLGAVNRLKWFVFGLLLTSRKATARSGNQWTAVGAIAPK